MDKKMKITFDRATADYILGVFEGTFHPECIFCKKHINKKNLSAIVKDGFICDNIICLIKYIDQRESEK